ncbi:MAG: hypothetical protein FJZ59_06810 [Chlamydiae bacterium]|nr:hypothetical protein [Chlamydiota bacterium]
MKSVGIHLCVNFCSMPCLDFLPTLIGSSDNTSFAERFSIYWRDAIMLTGIVITIITTVAAIFQGALFFATISLAVAGILSFGAHYVSRYAELQEMEQQLQLLQNETKRLSYLNNELQTSLDGFQKENLTFTTQNEELRAALLNFKAQLEQRAHELQETKRQFEEFKAGNEHLRQTSHLLSTARKELDETSHKLTEISIAYGRIQGQLTSDTQALQRIQVLLAKDAERLATSATRFEALEAAVTRLGQYVESLPSQPHLNHLSEIRTLLTELKT